MLLRPLILVPLAAMAALVLLVIIIVPLIFAGDPGACGGGRPLPFDVSAAVAYDERWLAFNQRLTSGLPSSMTVTETEATARARLFLIESSAPVKDVRICFVDDAADVDGTITTPFGWDADVRIKGTADLSGDHPKARIDSIRIGGVPRFMTRPFEGLVSRVVDDQLERIVVDHRLTFEIREGEATINGEP